MQSGNHFNLYILSAFITLLCVGLGASVWFVFVYRADIATLQAELASAQKIITEKENKISEFQNAVHALQEKYSLSEENGAELLKLLDEEKTRNDDFAEQIDSLSGTVGKLDKLSKIDPELLKKYSKVYFLNENFAPKKLWEIDTEFLARPEKPESVLSELKPFLRDLLEDAKDDGIDLRVLSGYRSFSDQQRLKGTYSVLYGTGANAFSADQGYSEHQLGTTIDFTTSELGANLSGFEATPAYAWLLKKAHRYGFTLSYPKDNSYYIYEPWHWRFVGTDLADDLHDDNIHFYDLDQRKIDEYLISIFD